MSTVSCLRCATALLGQTDDFSALLDRDRGAGQLAKRDRERSRQLLSELQRRVEANDGCRQRETRRMIKLETAEGLSGDLEKLVGTLAWQETKYAMSQSRSPAVPGTLAWYRTLHSAPGAGAGGSWLTNDTERTTIGEGIAAIECVAAQANVKSWQPQAHGSPPCRFVAAGAVPATKQGTDDGKAEPMGSSALSDAESETCSEASGSSSSWSGSASGSNADEEACSAQIARDANCLARLLAGARAGGHCNMYERYGRSDGRLNIAALQSA